MIPTFDQMEKRIVLSELYPLDPAHELTNGSWAFNLEGQYVDIMAVTLTGSHHISMPISLYTQIQQLTEAGIIIGYNVTPPAPAPTTITQDAFDFVVHTYEDWYTYFVGNPSINVTSPNPSYFDMVIDSAINSGTPLIGVTP